MAISVTCQCGKSYQAKDELAGRQLKCPACSQILVVPQLASPNAGLDLGDLGGFDLGTPGATGPLARYSARSSAEVGYGTRPKPPKKKIGRIVAIAGGGGVAVITLLVILLVVFVRRGDEPSSEAGNAAAADAGQEATSSSGASVESTGVARPLSSVAGSQPTSDRSFPSLPGAVSSAPQFLLADAPFDVQKFFETPLLDQNAAPLYLDALFEFSVEVAVCFSEAEQQNRRPIVIQRIDQSSGIHRRRLQDEGSVSSHELDAMLQEFAVGFQKLDLAQQRSGCVFESGIGISTLLPHVQAAREVARWTDIKTQRDVEEGRLDDAQKNVQRLLRLSRDLRRRGFIVSQLVSVAVDSICYEGPVKRLLAAPRLTAKQCDRLLAALAQHEQQAVDPRVESFRSEYIAMRTTIHDIQHRTGDFDPKFMKEELEVASIGALISGLYGTGSGSGQQAAKIDAYVAKMTDEHYANEVAKAKELYTSITALADRPYREQVQGIAAVESGLRTKATPLTSLLTAGTPSALEAFVRNEAKLHGTQCLVALRRWQLERQGKAPPDLATVVKAAGMTEVPRNPYGDGPLRLTQHGGKFVIYSVGKDGKDDNAQTDWKYGQQPGDFIFRMARES